jgi:uncharacterized protein (TIGR03067 family)
MPQDIDLLQGSWSIKSLALEGQEMPAAMFSSASMVVEGNRFTSLGMGTRYEGTLELDASTNPHQLNMNFDAGPEKGNVNLGIYEITGDIWKLSIATRGSTRPSIFISAPGTGITLEILQRVTSPAE